MNLLLVDKPKAQVDTTPTDTGSATKDTNSTTTTDEELPYEDEDVIDDTFVDKDLIDGEDKTHPNAVVPSGHQNSTQAIVPIIEPDVPE